MTCETLVGRPHCASHAAIPPPIAARERIAVETPDPLIIDRTDATAAARGEIDAHTAPLLRDAGSSILTEHSTIRFDLSGVEFIDSSGLGVLVALTAAARDAGGDLVIVAPSRAVIRLLEISGLEGHITIDQT